MKLAMTVMVRDEADIIRPMIEHHLEQGVDVFIVTDNGSVDGTAEILGEFAERGLIDLRHDPVQRKQQGAVVTGMARDAATRYGADWVINADADEFWITRDPALTLKQAFEHIDPAVRTFTVPVTDMTGPAARAGTGLQRLIYRDERDTEQLNAVGLHAHATPDAVHVGDPSIEVAQGNHFVNIESSGRPDDAYELEVLHFPWRSWQQFARKVENAGRAYEDNPELKPSPNHHGMRDYRRLLGGTLLGSYLVRNPTAQELADGLASGAFREERRVADRWPSPVPDEPIDEEQVATEYAYGRELGAMELRIRELERQGVRERDMIFDMAAHVDSLQERIAELTQEVREADARTDRYASRKLVRAADKVSRTLRRG
ncbi:glycosyltransferase family 2 protein [Leifsonia sp. RAF41]|uniref:glycosyltransferase family 2 protein n=1 Tax=Leifsonia sp. RAF41 TaxID=3233056 RepID=UPI003F9B011A